MSKKPRSKDMFVVITDCYSDGELCIEDDAVFYSLNAAKKHVEDSYSDTSNIMIGQITVVAQTPKKQKIEWLNVESL